jgi:Histidine kinase/Tetratricopeptide repeat/Soluble NSF attachment protein, SNAP
MKLKMIFTLFLYSIAFSQANQDTKEIVNQSSKLKRSINSNDDKATANTYYELGDKYYISGEFDKSESFYIKSLQIYEKLEDKNNIAKVSRVLAICQEKLNKLPQANFNYSNANKYESNKVNQKLNKNDANRLNTSNIQLQEENLKENIEVFKSTEQKQQLADGYEKLAEYNLKNKDLISAENNLSNSFKTIKKENPEKAIAIQEKISDIYVKEKNFDKAIESKKDLIKEDFVQKNTEVKCKQLQELANLYSQKENSEDALKTLEKAFEIAMVNGHTLEAKNSIIKLDSIFKTQNKPEKSLQFYRIFSQKLAELLKKDKNLIDEKIITETEEKIELLEKERQLKDDLIQEKSNFNTGLIIFIGLLILFLGLILLALKKLQTKNKKIALQSLRREMNPHFIFNSLNSVNHFISKNDELAANQYLTKFSKLMRGIMENSTDDYIPLPTEMELLQNYLALEKSRFQEQFDYTIEIDKSLENRDIKIPSMLIQPFIENAIWHGLRYKETKGNLNLSINCENDELIVKIQDNGIGIAKSKEIKTKNQKEHKGRGMNNTLERIKLLNELYQNKINYTINDSENGVLVILKFKISCK